MHSDWVQSEISDHPLYSPHVAFEHLGLETQKAARHRGSNVNIEALIVLLQRILLLEDITLAIANLTN